MTAPRTRPPRVDDGQTRSPKRGLVEGGHPKIARCRNARDLTICDRNRVPLTARSGDGFRVRFGGGDIESNDAIVEEVCDLSRERGGERGSSSSDW